MSFAYDKDNNRYRWDGNDWVKAELAYEEDGKEWAWTGERWTRENMPPRPGTDQSRLGDFADQVQGAFIGSFEADAKAVELLTGSEGAG